MASTNFLGCQWDIRVAPTSDAVNCQESYLLAFLTRQALNRYAGLSTLRSGSSLCSFRHNTSLPSTAAGSKSFAVMCLPALLYPVLYPDLIHRLHGFTPCFLSTPVRPHAVVFPFARCGQFTGGPQNHAHILSAQNEGRFFMTHGIIFISLIYVYVFVFCYFIGWLMNITKYNVIVAG